MKKSEDNIIQEVSLESEKSVIKRTRAMLEKEPKIKVRIKPDNKDDKGKVCVVINEYFYPVAKGEFVEVPESVAKLLEEGDYI